MIAGLTPFKCPLPFGAFNDTDDEMSLPPNILVNIQNMEFGKSSLKTRDGYSAYSTSGLPSTVPEMGMYAFKKSDGNRYLLAALSTALYVEGAVGVFSSVKTGLTASYPFGFTTLANLAIGANGTDKPVKYNGTTCKDLEVVAPTVAPTTALGSAGNLTGDYQYQITFVSTSGAETNPSSSSTVLTTSSDQVAITNIQTGGTEVTSRKIYRTTAGGSAFYFLDTINDNTTTTYTDDIADANLGTDLVPETHDTPPSNGKFPTVFKEFLFLVDPDFPTRIYFSHQSFPEIFYTAEGTGYYMIIGLNDGENVIGIKPLRETLYVFKERSTWPIIGGSPDDFKTTPQSLTSSIGLYHHSMEYVDMGSGEIIVGLGKNGLYTFNGYSYQNIGFQPDKGINISGLINRLDRNQLHKARGFNDIKGNKYRLSVMESGYAYNNKEIVWDYKHNQIAVHDIKRNSMVEWNGNVIFGSSQSDSIIHQVGGFNDNGTAISIIAEWPWWPLGDNNKVTFAQVNVDTTLQGDYSATFNTYVDGNNTAHALALAGSTTWASSSWATSVSNYRTKVPLQVVGSDGVHLQGTSIKCKLTHSGLNQPVTIHGLTVYYAPLNQVSGIDVDPTVLSSMGV